MSLVLNDISVYKNQQQFRLKELNCTFETGTLTLVIGQTGSGKSTLLDVASGILLPDAGTITVDGSPLWTGRRGRVRNPRLADYFGTVFQQADEQLFAQTIEGEFRYNLRQLNLSREQIKARAVSALAEVGLPASTLPMSPFHLSAGQRRRAALAGTIALQPKWWLLDEPTAGLDPVALQQFVTWLRRTKDAAAGGIIIVTHDLDALLPLADTIVILRGGEIRAQMTPAQLIAQPEPLIESGVGLPSALQLAVRCADAGLPIQLDGFTADAASTAIFNRLQNVSRLAASQAQRAQAQAVQAAGSAEGKPAHAMTSALVDLVGPLMRPKFRKRCIRRVFR